MIAAFVSKDDRLIDELVNEFDIVVSDRDDLEHLCEGKFYNLEHNEEEILKLFEEKGVSRAIALGYRRLFSEEFIERCEAELLNLHPSLLPAFKGLDVYQRVIDRGVEYSGATLHQISEEMDEGEIINQAAYDIPDGIEVKELKEKARNYEADLVREFLA